MVKAHPKLTLSAPLSAQWTGLSGGRRLVVMSNRAPIRVVHDRDNRERIEATVGGVGATFLRLLENTGGLWIAWSGSKRTPERLQMPPERPRFSMVFPPLSERDISYYYYGMCNRGLWPLMHLMPHNCYFEPQNWAHYQHVNRAFAELAANEAAPGDIIWAQDFHLALVPSLLRALRPELPIGIFWHVPFPPRTIFRILPWRKELLEGMLGCDLIGFHIEEYARYFLNCCEGVGGYEVDRDRGEVIYGNRRVKVGAFPLGIPADYFAALSASEPVRARIERIRRALRIPIMMLGVDRLDYTKGIPERVRGFERFLELNPAYRRRVTLVQIAVPSRTKMADYIRLKRELDETVGRVVGRFSSEGWVPVRYLYDQFDPEKLVSYYSAADVALLTPLRDGMNLVAKEFVASRIRDDGVLILSEFAGAAEELSEALMVNPYNVDEIAARIKQALEMSAGEKSARMRALRARVNGNNLEHWSQAFLDALCSAPALAQIRAPRAAIN
ncbi:MAG: trehalose-6-phosphate synthase [Candidatus Binataceae bacterium]